MPRRSTGQATRQGAPHRFGGLLWQRNYLLLWVGETISQLGSAMAVVGVPLVAVVTLHASTLVVGLLATAAYLPWLIIGLPVGVWADRYPPRVVMIVCDAISAVLYASVPIAAWAGFLTVGQLLGVQLLAGAASVMFTTAYQVYLPSLVAPDDLVEGNAKLEGSFSASALVGRGLAGVIAQALGTVFAVLLNACSFLVSAACLISIRAKKAARPSLSRARLTVRRDVAQGVRLVAHDRFLRPLSLFPALANFALVGYSSILVVFLVRVVGLKAGSVGLLVAVPGAGTLLGAFSAPKITARFGTARGLLICTLPTAPFGLLLPLTERGLRVGLYVVGVLIAAFGVGMASVIIASFRQRYCPSEVLGRVTATMRFLSMGASSIGALFAGALGTWLGTRNAMWVLLSILALSPACLLTPSLIRLRDLPRAE